MATADEWWTSLKISEKERIAGKVTGAPCAYPECTHKWLALDEQKKEWIKEHCTRDHGIVIPAWSEGFMYSE